MTAPLNPRLAGALAPPIMEAAAWARAATYPANRPLINMAQAVPAAPPPVRLREAIAAAALSDDDAHLYGPVLGDEALREEIARGWTARYGSSIAAGQVAVTAGCNQAFCAAIASVAAPGDAVILPTPWYFNHKMWLNMAGVDAQPLSTGDDCLPDPGRAAALIGANTRAIALVSPNNPTGVEYPPALIKAFYDLARARGLALILDETYLDYHAAPGAPHALFQEEGWEETLIHLYSFSKIYRLTGHRTGALITGARRLAQIEKFLDTVAICPPRLGQIAALTGLRELGDHRAEERQRFLDRRAALEAAFAAGVGDWRLEGVGAFFAYVRHPFDAPSPEIAKDLVSAQSLLVLPGTYFGPSRDEGGDGRAEATCRIAFANVAEDGIAEMAARLAAYAP